MSNNDEWMRSSEAQRYLERTDRQLRRYTQSGRLRTRVVSGRIQYHRGDLQQLRSELIQDTRLHAPEQQIIPAGELLNYIRELQQQIAEAAAREGALRAMLESRPKLEDQQILQQQLTEERARRESLEGERKRLEEEIRGVRSGERTIRIALVLAVILIIGLIIFLVLQVGR